LIFPKALPKIAEERKETHKRTDVPVWLCVVFWKGHCFDAIDLAFWAVCDMMYLVRIGIFYVFSLLFPADRAKSPFSITISQWAFLCPPVKHEGGIFP